MRETNKTKTQLIQQKADKPANCSDIRELGYTLNGFYIVADHSTGRFGVVFCQFKLPPTEAYQTKGMHVI